jgi:ABC-type uncharacterized transport system permease subunit
MENKIKNNARRLLNPFYLFYMSILKIINYFLTSAVLILIFYLIVTPTGLILRLCGKDLLGLKDKNSDSYWIKKEDGLNLNKDSYLKQY